MTVDLRPLYPAILLSVMGLAVALLGTARRASRLPLLGWLTTAAALSAIALDWLAPNGAPWNGIVRFDAFSRAFDTVFLVVLAVVALASVSGEHRMRFAGEYYALLAFSTVGMMLMSCSGGLLALYLGVELSTMCLYTLVGISKRDSRSVEAAMKLYMLGAVASAVLLYGISMVFGATGSTQYDGIVHAIAAHTLSAPAILWLGIAFVVGGLAFKMSAAPFHLWAPDVYEGAPSTVTAFLSTASKTAAFAGLVRFLVAALTPEAASWVPVIVGLSAISMIAGNLAALVQTNLKRMLAYSGVAQAGYMLVALAAAHDRPIIGIGSLWTYLLLYAFTNVAGFLIVQAMYDATGSDRIDALQGLHKRSPLLAFSALIVLFSLGGIPPLAGFFGKLYLFAAGWGGRQQALVVLGAATSVIALYYYLSVACQVYIRDPVDASRIRTPRPLAVAISVSVAAVIAIGIYPLPIVRLGDSAAHALLATPSSAIVRTVRPASPHVAVASRLLPSPEVASAPRPGR